MLRQRREKTKQNIAKKLKAKTQPQTLASVHKKNINMPKEKENAENIDIDIDNDDTFDEQYQFTNPRAKSRGYGFFESSEEELEAYNDDAQQPSASTSGKQKEKPGIDEIGVFVYKYLNWSFIHKLCWEHTFGIVVYCLIWNMVNLGHCFRVT